MQLESFLWLMVTPFLIGIIIWYIIEKVKYQNAEKRFAQGDDKAGNFVIIGFIFDNPIHTFFGFIQYIIFTGKLYCVVGWITYIYLNITIHAWKELIVGTIVYPYGIIFGWDYILQQIH